MSENYRKDYTNTDEMYIKPQITNHENTFNEETNSEIAASISAASKNDYDHKYILTRLLEGKTRHEIADELNHKSYRTLDMYMRRRGYIWDSERQLYVFKTSNIIKEDEYFSSNKAQKIISLFETGNDPREIAKKVGMKDHRTLAEYMKSKGYYWSSDKQNYVLSKGQVHRENYDTEVESADFTEDFCIPQVTHDEISDNHINRNSQENIDSLYSADSLDRIEKLLPMLEMIDRNRDKLAELLAINTSNTIPRYIIGGITITKSLCMSHHLAELIKEFSKEKNISQREIFEVAIVEFLKKYGYENEVNALFMT